MPGCLAGAFVADLPSMGPKKTLAIGVFLQGIIGFIMAGCYPWLNKPKNVAGFVIVYGVFLALGEFGPGDNIGLVASKTCATGIRYVVFSSPMRAVLEFWPPPHPPGQDFPAGTRKRKNGKREIKRERIRFGTGQLTYSLRGQYYGLAAAIGKIGAFAGSYALDALQTAAGADTIAAGRNPFFVASSLAFLAGGLVFLLPDIGQSTIDEEDVRFRAYLRGNGYDTSKMGLEGVDGVDGDSERVGSG
jgi:hypothetical protein